MVEECDLSRDSEVPWYLPIDSRRSLLTLEGFRTTWLGRGFTRVLVYVLETLGVAPKGSVSVSQFLEKGADALVEGGRCAGPGPALCVFPAWHMPPRVCAERLTQSFSSFCSFFLLQQGRNLHPHVFYFGAEASQLIFEREGDGFQRRPKQPRTGTCVQADRDLSN